jgi:hypothetical protein
VLFTKERSFHESYSIFFQQYLLFFVVYFLETLAKKRYPKLTKILKKGKKCSKSLLKTLVIGVTISSFMLFLKIFHALVS